MTIFSKKATKIDNLPEKMGNFDKFLQPKIQKTKAFQELLLTSVGMYQRKTIFSKSIFNSFEGV